MAKKKSKRSEPMADQAKPQAADTSQDERTVSADQKTFPIVGMGASAGGLDAFKKFFSRMPIDSGAAFVLVPHLDPTHKSLMVEILATQTGMTVSEAQNAEPVQPNRVYLIPENKYLSVEGGKFRLMVPAERFGQPTAIDYFFRSLAADQQERAIAIVLSGTSNHGTVGIKEIKLAGGLVMVQQPETAQYNAMPRNAIATGIVDLVLPPEQMPDKLVKYLQHPYVRLPIERTTEKVTREQLAHVAALLKARTKYDFGSYRKRMLTRRLLRRMGLSHLESVSEYLDFLRDDPNEITLLYQDLLIGVTEFFRDPEAFQVLQQRVIPEFLQVGETIRVWVPACATGEEAYSVAMLFMEQFATDDAAPRLQIFATDIDERSLEIARHGAYSEGAVAGVSPERLARFFNKIDAGHWQVNKRLRSVVTFAQQNLISDAPFSKLNLISCRNLLIYLEPEVQAKVIRLFHFALTEGGFLFLGPSETVGRQDELFETVSRKWRLFHRLGGARRELVQIPIVASDQSRRFSAFAATPTSLPAIGFKELIQRLVLNDYAPAAALVNRKFEIVSVLGPLVNYLEFPPGEIANDIFAMARPGLRTKLRAVLLKAFQSETTVVDRNARVKRDGIYVDCSVTVKPVAESKEALDLVLVTFQDREPSGSSEVATLFLDTEFHIKRFTPPVAKLLNLRETDLDRPFRDFAPKFQDQTLLDDCREVLRDLVPREKEVWANDEDAERASPLKPPLVTDGRCYLRRILPYRSVDNGIVGVVIDFIDVTKLMAAELLSRRLTAVLLDSNDAVTVHDFEGNYSAWNRGAERMYGYTESEALKMNAFDTIPKSKRAETLAYVEQLKRDESVVSFETQRINKDGLALDVELTITAYRDENGHPIGVSTTERDITERNRLALALRLANRSLERRVTKQTSEVKLLAKALSHLGEGVLITSGELDSPGPKVMFVNEAMCRMSGYTVDDFVGQSPQLLYSTETDKTELKRIKNELSAGRSCLAELVNYRKDGTAYDVEIFISPLFNDQGSRTHFVSIQREITERKRIAKTLDESEQRMQAILNTASDAIITIDHRGIITSVNPSTERMFLYAREELIGNNVSMLMPSPYREEHDVYLARYERTGEAKIIGIGREVVGQRKDGTNFPMDLAVSEVDHLGMFTGIVRDISNRKILENQIIEIAVEEQRRIGQELHDGTGQELTGLSLFAGTLVELLSRVPKTNIDGKVFCMVEESELEPIKRTASKILKGVVEANLHVQQLARGIMPVQIEVEGLRVALEDLAAAIDGQSHISCHFACPAPVDVANNTTATHLYRIAQEAVSNAVRHSHASKIEILLSQHEGEILLEVSDNGIGFDHFPDRPSAAVKGSGGFGLGIMGYRAGIIGGTLRMIRHNEGGTRVRCTAPRISSEVGGQK